MENPVYLSSDSEESEIEEIFPSEDESPRRFRDIRIPQPRIFSIRHPQQPEIEIKFEEHEGGPQDKKWIFQVQPLSSPLFEIGETFAKSLRDCNNFDSLPTASWMSCAEEKSFPLARTVWRKNLPTRQEVDGFKFNYIELLRSHKKGYKKAQVYECSDNIEGVIKCNIHKKSQIKAIFDVDIYNEDSYLVADARILDGPNANVKGCLVLENKSHNMVETIVDLGEWGIDSWILDYVRPKILVSQYISCSPGYSGHFTLAAELLPFKRRMRCIDRVHLPEFNDLTENNKRFKVMSRIEEVSTAWKEYCLEFSNYPSGMRYLAIATRTKIDEEPPEPISVFRRDLGLRVAEVFLEVVLPEEPILKPLKKDRDLCRFDDPNYLENSDFQRDNQHRMDCQNRQDVRMSIAERIEAPEGSWI